MINTGMSLPSRKCGLKLSASWYFCPAPGHFLRGSVDWNRKSNAKYAVSRSSLPSRKCGLKSTIPDRTGIPHSVTSFAEVWIEIIIKMDWGRIQAVTSFAEVWIEICLWIMGHQTFRGHFLRGSVDWNRISQDRYICSLRHFLRGSVDWNINVQTAVLSAQVTSFAEVWIEISVFICIRSLKIVTSFAEVWIEIQSRYRKMVMPSGHFLRGSVDWNARLDWSIVAGQGHFLRGSVDWNPP